MSSPRQIYQVIRTWLVGKSGLKEAVRKTVGQGLFPEEDVRFAVGHISDSMKPHLLEQWWKRSVSGEKSAAGQTGRNILCLHAGNLPLVGLQDVIAVLLSGNRYYGKISRKDPWLTASFIETCMESGIPEVAGYSTDIGQFRNLAADAVLFSGSGKSVPPVREALKRLGAVHAGTRYLIRTAQLSAAFVEREDSAVDLFEAVTRYAGRGCRSVGVVVSPMGLEDYGGFEIAAVARLFSDRIDRIHRTGDDEAGDADLEGEGDGAEDGNEAEEVDLEVKVDEDEDEVEVEVEVEVEDVTGSVMGGREGVSAGSRDDSDGNDRTGRKPDDDGGLLYLKAYAEAVGWPYRIMGNWLFIETVDTGLIRPGLVLWIRGGEEVLQKVRARLGGRLQAVYSDSGSVGFEDLKTAQRPGPDWKPDGVDTLAWLKEPAGGID